MIVNIVLDVGHRIRKSENKPLEKKNEWPSNNKVVSAAIHYLEEYENATVIRLDDSSGGARISL